MPTTLFSPLSLGDLTLPNRVVMAPMTRSRATDDHVVQPMTATYYAQRASGGLLVTEGIPVSQQGVGYVRVPGIWDARRADAWRPVTDAVHAAGGRIFAQIWHVGRVSHQVFQPDGAAPVAPSAIAAEIDVYTPEGPARASTPRALELDEIPQIVADFVAAARRALEAGFDGVEIHGANGYLLEQFLFSGSNHRTDAYGGSVDGRMRLVLEVVDAVVAEVGPGRAGLRISPHNTFNGVHEDDRPTLARALASALHGRGLAYLHVVEPVGTPEPLLPEIKERLGGIVIVNGGYDADSAEAVLAAGHADLVAFGQSYLANPDLPERLATGAPLNPPDRSTFYTPGPEGYLDYPTLEGAAPYVRLLGLQVTDQDGYRAYREQMAPLLEAHGGPFGLDLTVGDVLRSPVDAPFNRVFTIAFPDANAAARFYDDPRYREIRARHFDPAVAHTTQLGQLAPAS